MSQFSLYENNDKNTRTTYPYFVDVQNELLSSMSTRLVIPLTPLALLESKAPSILCPVIHVEQGDFVILTHQMAAISASTLKNAIDDLSAFRDEIVAAIDFLITGI